MMSGPDLTTGWITLPRGVEADTPLFAVSDAHGDAALLRRAIRFAGLTPGRDLYFLGDLIDRGPDSFGCVEAALAAKRNQAFARVITLAGNHEAVLAAYIAASPRDPALQSRNIARNAMIRMGGALLVQACEDAPEVLIPALRSYVDGLGMWAQNGGIALCHAVPDPYKAFPKQTEQDLLWSFSDEKNRLGWDALIGRPCVLVHGHTQGGPALKGRTGAAVGRDLYSSLRLFSRICCDSGAPRSNALSLLEIDGGRARFHGFWGA